MTEPQPIDEADRPRLLRELAVAFAPCLPSFGPIKRAQLLDGLSLILTGEESERARYAANVLRVAEEAQTTFLDLL